MRCSSALSIVLVHSFLLASAVAAAPAQSELPTPESVLGFRVGADFRLATYGESIAYFQQLAQASDRVVLLPVGRTSEGKLWYMALISSSANLAQVDRYREIARRLASPGDLDDEQARALAREARRSFISTGACTRPRWRTRSTPSSSPTSWPEAMSRRSRGSSMTGGIGKAGVRGLQEFVRAGGTLVCLNASSLFAIEQLDLAVENAVVDLERAEFFSGVSLLRGQPFGTLRLIFNALVLPPGVAARAQ